MNSTTNYQFIDDNKSNLVIAMSQYSTNQVECYTVTSNSFIIPNIMVPFNSFAKFKPFIHVDSYDDYILNEDELKYIWKKYKLFNDVGQIHYIQQSELNKLQQLIIQSKHNNQILPFNEYRPWYTPRYPDDHCRIIIAISLNESLTKPYVEPMNTSTKLNKSMNDCIIKLDTNLNVMKSNQNIKYYWLDNSFKSKLDFHNDVYANSKIQH